MWDGLEKKKLIIINFKKFHCVDIFICSGECCQCKNNINIVPVKYHLKSEFVQRECIHLQPCLVCRSWLVTRLGGCTKQKDYEEKKNQVVVIGDLNVVGKEKREGRKVWIMKGA